MTIDLTQPTLWEPEPTRPLPGRVRRYQTKVDDTHKVCLNCLRTRHVDEYGRNACGVLGRQAVCRECIAVRAKESWDAQTPEERKRRMLRDKFGITLEEYNAMRDAQGGVCAICHHPETVVDRRSGKVRDLAVDHNHETGEIRGLLCGRCNSALGHIGDDPELLLEAAMYLERTGHYAGHARRRRVATHRPPSQRQRPRAAGGRGRR